MIKDGIKNIFRILLHHDFAFWIILNSKMILDMNSSTSDDLWHLKVLQKKKNPGEKN